MFDDWSYHQVTSYNERTKSPERPKVPPRPLSPQKTTLATRKSPTPALPVRKWTSVLRRAQSVGERKFDRTTTLRGRHFDFLEQDLANWVEIPSEATFDRSFAGKIIIEHEPITMLRFEISRYISLCDSTTSHITEIITNLERMKEGYDLVARETIASQETVKDQNQEQQNLFKLADNLTQHLHIFESLDPITRQLNAPGSDLVSRPEFQTLLQQIDEAITFASANPTFRDAELYLLRFRQCMTRALTMMRSYFTSSIRSTTAEVSKMTLNENTQTALLYAKFQVNAPRLKRAVIELEKRATAEYSSFISDCWNAYFASRKRLVLPVITKRMAEIPTGIAINAARTGLSFMRTLTSDESDLYYAHFDASDTPELGAFFSTLWLPFVDVVRPRIIQETQLTMLCDICSLLKSADTMLQHVKPILEDTESRIIYIANSLAIRDIQHYHPQDSDLAYPANLSRILIKADSESAAAFTGWYPPLYTTMWILSRIHTLVNPRVFNMLAHDISRHCIASLVSAHKLIKPHKDADLFLIKHLLILRDQLASFDVDQGPPDVNVDFSGVTGALWNLFSSATVRRPSASSFLVENTMDARDELNARLRDAITRITESTAKKIMDDDNETTRDIILEQLLQDADTYLQDRDISHLLVEATIALIA